MRHLILSFLIGSISCIPASQVCAVDCFEITLTNQCWGEHELPDPINCGDKQCDGNETCEILSNYVPQPGSEYFEYHDFEQVEDGGYPKTAPNTPVVCYTSQNCICKYLSSGDACKSDAGDPTNHGGLHLNLSTQMCEQQ